MLYRSMRLLGEAVVYFNGKLARESKRREKVSEKHTAFESALEVSHSMEAAHHGRSSEERSESAMK